MNYKIFRPDAADEIYTEERCHILELSNSAADDGLSIARARVEPNVTTALHRLAGTIERYVILQGQGLVEVGGGAPERVAAGNVVVIPAGASQRITNTGNVDLVFLALCTPRFRPQNYANVEVADASL